MKGTVTQNPLDRPGDEDRRNRGRAVVREVGDSQGLREEAGEELKREAVVESRNVCHSRPGLFFSNSPQGLVRAELLVWLILG